MSESLHLGGMSFCGVDDPELDADGQVRWCETVHLFDRRLLLSCRFILLHQCQSPLLLPLYVNMLER